MYDKEIVNEFIKKYDESFKEKFIIYGTGLYAKDLYQHCDRGCFVAFADGNKKSGYFCGQNIIPLDERLPSYVRTVIIAAAPENEFIIYERIKKYCSQHALTIMGISYGNLSKIITKQDLQVAIENHESISFDIFDTLLMRKTLYPRDVFEILEYKAIIHGLPSNNLMIERIRAERNLASRNCNLFEIYRELQRLLNITDKERDALRELELSIETNVLIPRKDMVELLYYAKKIGKKIYLISDMYLTTDILEPILRDNGITGFNDIIISCEKRCNKLDGLFGIYKNNIISDSYLHIGDSWTADFVAAAKEHIDVILIQSSLGLFKDSNISYIGKYLYSLDDRSMMGAFIARCFNSPFSKRADGKITVSRLEDVHALFIAPLVTCCVLWLVKKLSRGEYDKVLFASRDGYLIKELYNWYVATQHITKAPPSVYLYTSRKSSVGAAISTVNDIDEYIEYRGKTAFENIFSGDNFESVEDVIKVSEGKKQNLKKYILKLGLKPNEKYAFFDLVSGGTTQYYLSKSFFNNIEGFYLNYSDIGFSEQIIVHSLFFDMPTAPFTHFETPYTAFLESVLTSLEPSVVGFDEEGEPVFSPHTRNSSEESYISTAHETIREYFIDFVENLYIDDCFCNPVIAINLSHFISDKQSCLSHDLFENIRHDNDLVINKITNLSSWIEQI